MRNGAGAMGISNLMMDSTWTMYAVTVLLPFVQEDAAVLAAATASITGHGDARELFIATLIGLTASDTWKYWAGRLAHSHPWAAKMASDPRIAAARERVLNRLSVTLLIARFVPGTRIPLYIACGLFKAPFWRFFVTIIATAALYIAIAFTIFAHLGMRLGEQVRGYIPVAVIALVVLMLAVGWIRSALRKRAA